MDHPFDYSYFYDGCTDLTCVRANDQSVCNDYESSKAGKQANKGQTPIKSSTSPPTDKGVTVRSNAIVTYSASKSNAVYSCLPPQTDINDTPSNWLRKTIGLRPESLLFGPNYVGNRSREFSGFTMAGCHLQHIGKIDVVSDAENIKKLLKMPYSDAHVSMVIHRIGRTLLLEKFDVKKHITKESQWKNFRDFYEGFFQQQGANSLKKKSPSSQHERIMHSKFLYHSVCEDSLKKLKNFSPIVKTTEDEKSTPGHESNTNLCDLNKVDYVVPKVHAISMEDKKAGEDNPPSPDRRWRYWSANENSPENSRVLDEEAFGFERNIFWTFEDLRMILGTNMPIFGGGKYPAVSLRLRDSQKPINVLTGIDYWLDNLICNVPELVMCFHVDGIVQNYEFIKTEDIPKLKESGFSPQVIKDIAQNILSFLKSNCTKEGHTYWLFKGSGADAVKLYDLSTLCHNDAQDSKSGQQQNPYGIPVAMLLYKTALNLLQSRQDPISGGCDHSITVRKLLLHCVKLLEESKYQHITGHAICLLTELCLSESNVEYLHGFSDDDSGSLHTAAARKTCDTCSAYSETDEDYSSSEQQGEERQEIASSSVSDLPYPEKFVSSAASTQIQESHNLNMTLEESCSETIEYAVTGLALLSNGWKKRDHCHLIQHLLKSAAKAYFGLAEKENEAGKTGCSLIKIQLALRCYETYEFLVLKFGPQPSTLPWTSTSANSVLLLPKILSLCGEIQFGIGEETRRHCQHMDSKATGSENQEFKNEKMLKLLSIVCESGGKYDKLAKINTDLGDTLEVCGRCYEMAITVLDEGCGRNTKCVNVNPPAIEDDSIKRAKRGPGKASSACQNSQSRRTNEFRNTMIRRHGHVLNERGALMLDAAVTNLNKAAMEDSSAKTVTESLEEAASCFKNAHDRFYQVHDYLNQALVLSNTGRLMRVSAQFHTEREDTPLSATQRANFESAVFNYQKALEILDSKDVKRNSAINEASAIARDNISWDLSTCYLAMAQILQDSGFGDHSSREDLEKEVTSWLKNSQKYCKTIWKNSDKFPTVLYRQSDIYHRLASLYHNSYRVCSEPQKTKYLRNLAEKNYANAIEILSEIDHPNKLLRVQLERLAMKEYYINSVSSVTHKSGLVMEGLQLLCLCSKTLETMQNTLVEKHSNPSEIVDLLRILVTILQSFLFILVKLSSQDVASPSRKSKNAKTVCPKLAKDLYGRALKNLQPVSADRETVSSENIVNDFSLIAGILGDVSRLIFIE